MTTLADENGNVNCLYCINCYNCHDCVGCVNCNNCDSCTNCKDCIHCRNCLDVQNCEECDKCRDCQYCFRCAYCEGAIVKTALMGYKDYVFYVKDQLVFPNKGRCQYSDKIESFFLVHGLLPYNRNPKNTSFPKKSIPELLKGVDYLIDPDELQSLIDSQGVQIAWNIGLLYKRYWITLGRHRASCTINDLALFLIFNKLVISNSDIQKFTGQEEVPYDLRMFQIEFQRSFSLLDLVQYL